MHLSEIRSKIRSGLALTTLLAICSAWIAPSVSASRIRLATGNRETSNKGTSAGRSRKDRSARLSSSRLHFPAAAAHPTPTPLSVSRSSNPEAAASVQLSTESASVSEGAGFALLNVTRTGDTSGTASVDYMTLDGTASQRSKYE